MSNGPKLITTTVANDENGNNIVSFNVNGVDDTIRINIETLSPEVRDNLIVHGLRQKVSDGAAIKKELEPTPLDKFTRMKSIADRLIAGEWIAKAGDGTGAVAGVNWLAYREYMTAQLTAKKAKFTETDIRAAYDRLTRSQVLALKTIPEIGAIISRINSERGTAASKIDADSLLAEFGL